MNVVIYVRPEDEQLLLGVLRFQAEEYSMLGSGKKIAAILNEYAEVINEQMSDG